MKFCNIASGSKGNATFISTNDTLILIDVGISYKALKKQCEEVGIDLTRLDAVLITHEHSDHIGGLRALSQELDVPIYMNPLSYKEAVKKSGDILHVQEEEFIHPITIKDVQVSAFRHTHDAKYTQGFSLTDGNKTVVMATDLGKVTDGIYKKMQGADFLYIESNYDYDSLIAGPYPQFLKQRVAGPLGHLCNIDSSETIKRLVQEGKERFMLAHLSEVNNTKEMATNTLISKLKEIGASLKDIELFVADQRVPSEVIDI